MLVAIQFNIDDTSATTVNTFLNGCSDLKLRLYIISIINTIKTKPVLRVIQCTTCFCLSLYICTSQITNILKSFIVDGNKAGPGHLELEVSEGNDTLVASSVRSLGGHRYAASFNPRESKPHTVRVTFNDENVPGESVYPL